MKGMTSIESVEISREIRTRFAPSPTGYLHIGSLRTALYNYLFAKHFEGKFFLRVEDTDRSRYVKDAEEKLQESLRWTGIVWDNEKIIRQSDRLSKYKKYVEKLVFKGYAYPCFCSSGELEALRRDQQEQKQAPRYDRRCLRLSQEKRIENIRSGMPHTIRFRVPLEEVPVVEFLDMIRGKVRFQTDILDDPIIMKSDGFPTYHFAVVVDDHCMNITHVIRGEEWLPSTPKHILLYRAFGWEPPIFAHLPLLLNPDGKGKLSKRQGDVSVSEYAEKGYLREALINFIALLGWNPGKGSEQEIFSLDELKEQFTLERVNKSGAVFDVRRLDWMNSVYIKKLSIDALYERSLPFIQKNSQWDAIDDRERKHFWKRVLTVEQDRLFHLDEIGEKNPFFFTDLKYEKSLLRWKDMDDEILLGVLRKAKKIVSDIDEKEWTRDFLGKTFLLYAGENRGEFLWPLRVALTGAKHSPPPQDVAWVIGKQKTLSRICRAIDFFVEK